MKRPRTTAYLLSVLLAGGLFFLASSAQAQFAASPHWIAGPPVPVPHAAPPVAAPPAASHTPPPAAPLKAEQPEAIATPGPVDGRAPPAGGLFLREPPHFPIYGPRGPRHTLYLGYDVFDATRDFIQTYFLHPPQWPPPPALGVPGGVPGGVPWRSAVELLVPPPGIPRGGGAEPGASPSATAPQAFHFPRGCDACGVAVLAQSPDPPERGWTADPSLPDFGRDAWHWQLLPRDLIWRAYLAGPKESRMRSVWVDEKDQGMLWDITLGGRAGIVRYGDTDPLLPSGWQLDIEGAALPRLDLEDERDIIAADFRFGLPLTYGLGPYRSKFAYYHLSSHLGDEFLMENPHVTRYNYSRDVLVWGHSYYLTSAVRLYGEAGWAFYSDVAEPWEFQVGAEYLPLAATGFAGAPFFAVNGHLREEVDFGGNLVVQAGWAWRGQPNGGVFRAGFEFFEGMDEQFSFFNQHLRKLGFGLWYDF